MKLICGDNRQTLKTLPDQSVQCIVTSPPYYGLRDYGNDNQIGLESTPELYVAELVAVFRECKRVLKDDGTLWCNLGDSYWANRSVNGQSYDDNEVERKRAGGKSHQTIKPKDLIGIPWMVAFALRADGWYLRSDIIWHKPNPMPESVTDRPTKSHEYMFLLTKSSKYYYDYEAVLEPATGYDGRKDTMMKGSKKYADGSHLANGNANSLSVKGRERWRYKNLQEDGQQPNSMHLKRLQGEEYMSPVRNKRDVWTVNTKPYKGAHFATFPPDLIEPCILAGTSERGECPNCGKAWVRVVERENHQR
jgi:DNA modification methylase